MQKVYMLILGLGMSFGFMGLYYFIQDHRVASIRNEAHPARAERQERATASTKPNVSQDSADSLAPVASAQPVKDAGTNVAKSDAVTLSAETALATGDEQPVSFEIKTNIEQAKQALGEVETRFSTVEKELDTLKGKRTLLKRTLVENEALLEIFGETTVLPRQGSQRDSLIKLAMAIVSVTPRGEKPFARLSAMEDRVQIQMDARSLFAPTGPQSLVVSKSNHLTDTMQSLPQGFKVQSFTIYQATDSIDKFAETRLKALQQNLRALYGKTVDEINIHLTRRELIPNKAQFLLEMNTVITRVAAPVVATGIGRPAQLPNAQTTTQVDLER